MHKIALEPDKLYKLWADGSDAGAEEVDLERQDHTYLYVAKQRFSIRAVSQPIGGS